MGRSNRRAAPLSLRPTCAHRARIISSKTLITIVLLHLDFVVAAVTRLWNATDNGLHSGKSNYGIRSFNCLVVDLIKDPRVAGSLPRSNTIKLSCDAALLYVLQYFPNAFNRRLHFDHGMSNWHIVGLGTNCIDLSKHFLSDKFQLSAQRLLAVDKGMKLLNV